MCCGREQAGLGQRPARANAPRGGDTARAVSFTYTGRTGLAVVGTVTRRLYRFEGTGATLDVDRRDATGLAAVPSLRRAE